MVPIKVPDGVSLAAVIVNYRTADLTIDCLASLADARDAGTPLVAVAVDGASGDGSAEAIAAAIAGRRWGDWAHALPLPVNGGFGYANNQAILSLDPVPPFILLINPDAVARPGAIFALLSRMERTPDAAAVGAALFDEAGEPVASAFHFPDPGGEFLRAARTGLFRRLFRLPETVIPVTAALAVPWVTGAAVLLRTAALIETGLFDDGFFLYFEETELMLRLQRAGWTIWSEPEARVVHIGGAATDVRGLTEPARTRPPRLPAYWYASRRRYFALSRGATGAMAADAAFLLGRAVWRLRCLIERRPDPFPLATGRDTLARNTRKRAVRPSRVRLGDPPGRLPQWMDPAP